MSRFLCRPFYAILGSFVPAGDVQQSSSPLSVNVYRDLSAKRGGNVVRPHHCSLLWSSKSDPHAKRDSGILTLSPCSQLLVAAATVAVCSQSPTWKGWTMGPVVAFGPAQGPSAQRKRLPRSPKEAGAHVSCNGDRDSEFSALTKLPTSLEAAVSRSLILLEMTAAVIASIRFWSSTAPEALAGASIFSGYRSSLYERIMRGDSF